MKHYVTFRERREDVHMPLLLVIGPLAGLLAGWAVSSSHLLSSPAAIMLCVVLPISLGLMSFGVFPDLLDQILLSLAILSLSIGILFIIFAELRAARKEESEAWRRAIQERDAHLDTPSDSADKELPAVMRELIEKSRQR